MGGHWPRPPGQLSEVCLQARVRAQGRGGPETHCRRPRRLPSLPRRALRSARQFGPAGGSSGKQSAARPGAARAALCRFLSDLGVDTGEREREREREKKKKT